MYFLKLGISDRYEIGKGKSIYIVMVICLERIFLDMLLIDRV